MPDRPDLERLRRRVQVIGPIGSSGHYRQIAIAYTQDIPALLAYVERLEAALREIAADHQGDNWEPYDTWTGYAPYRNSGGNLDSVDDSNSGDVHGHGIAVGAHHAGRIARRALGLAE